MFHNVHMSCGHFQQLDLATTGKQLKIDLDYYNQQGLCADCWAKLRARREVERAELQARRQRKHMGGYENGERI